MKKILFIGVICSILLSACGNSEQEKADREKYIKDSIENAFKKSPKQDSISKSEQTSNLPAPTTMEEFNYITKGYKVQIESGLDMKAGYEFQDVKILEYKAYGSLQKYLNSGYCNVKRLFRTNTNETAAYLFYLKSMDESEDDLYICIPSPTSEEEVQKAFARQCNKMISEALVPIMWLSILEW